LVELWPKHGEERVAPVRAARGGDGEISEEREPTRLTEEADDVTTIGRGDAHRPEHSELDHVAASGQECGVTCGVTFDRRFRDAAASNWLREPKLSLPHACGKCGLREVDHETDKKKCHAVNRVCRAGGGL
jgi:hypothetical protein